jgi:hypothetical protein
MNTSSTSILESLRFFGAYIGMSDADPRLIIARLIHMALGFVGIILLLAILSSGFSFMVSGGDEEKTASAKRTLFNAIIGVIIILSAYSIVNFVLNGLVVATTGTAEI